MLDIYSLEDNLYGIVSDTHIGNKFDNIEYIKRTYDYFANNNISTVLHLGDLLEGYQENNKAIFKRVCYDQIERLLKYYPDYLDTFLLLGNHDWKFKNVGINLPFNLKDTSFILVNEDNNGVGYIDLNNKKILLRHNVQKQKYLPYNLCLKGHSHFYNYKDVNRIINVPTLSDVHPEGFSKDRYTPGFLTLKVEEDYIIIDYYIIVENKIILKERKNILVKDEINYQKVLKK